MEQICGNCFKKSAAFICMRCNVETYCSKDCQIQAFPQHRRECFSIPLLKIIGENMPSISSPNNSGELYDDSDKSPNVVVNNINQPQKVNGSTNKKPEEKVETVEEVPEVAVKNGTQKELVTPAFNAGVRTVAPNTYKKSPSVTSIPKQAEQEKRVVEEATPKAAPEKKMFGMDQMRRTQQTPMMNQQPKKPKETRYFRKDMKIRGLCKGKQKVRLVNQNDATKIFFVTEAIKDVDEYVAYIESNINDYVKADKSTSYKPQKDEMVLAKFDGVYYRAAVEDIDLTNPNKPIYDIFFVDYGNKSQVTEKELKPFAYKLSSELVLNPVYLQNFPENVTDKQAEVLSDENGLEIDIKGQSEDCYIAEILGI